MKINNVHGKGMEETPQKMWAEKDIMRVTNRKSGLRKRKLTTNAPSNRFEIGSYILRNVSHRCDLGTIYVPIPT
jgi:hypothetical protein